MILYELLTGRRPYLRTKDDNYSREKAVIETRVARPSTVLGQSTARYESLHHTDENSHHLEWCGGMSKRQLQRQLSGDLDNILLMALRKEPQRRYPSVMAFSSDIGHYIADEPVSARAATWTYLSGKFLARHRYSSALVLGLIIAIIGFSVTTWVQSRQIAIERDTARVEQAKARAVFDFLVDMLSSVSPDKAQGREITVREVLDESNEQFKQSNHALSATPELEAMTKRTIGNIYASLGFLQSAQVSP